LFEKIPCKQFLNNPIALGGSMPATLTVPKAVPVAKIKQELFAASESTPGRAVMLDMLAVLAELGLMVYRNSEVRLHQQRMQAKLSRRLHSQLVAAGVMSALLVVAMIVTTAVSASPTLRSVCGIGMAATLAMLLYCGWRWFEGAYWRSHRLEDYATKKVIPREVQTIIDRLAGHPKHFSLIVHALQIDPILEVRSGKASCCVAIWEKSRLDEPLVGQH
jgi:hypothetical protein